MVTIDVSQVWRNGPETSFSSLAMKGRRADGRQRRAHAGAGDELADEHDALLPESPRRYAKAKVRVFGFCVARFRSIGPSPFQTSDGRRRLSCCFPQCSREQTQRDTELRAEQERNFQEALEADQRRQREAAEAREREEEAARLEAQRQAEREEEERRALEEAKAALRRKRDAIGEEPPAGPGVTRLRFQFPNGQKVTRRFQQDETVGSVKTFLEVHCADNDFALQTLGISSSHPKRDYDNDSETLVECGLHPQAALFVRDLDA
eukprot:scaffold719_cov226-Pinguiococcus_pyrenoidosus.AAC.4